MEKKQNTGEAPARFSCYEEEGELIFLDEGLYCFLFVIEGSVQLSYHYHVNTIGKGNMLVIDKQQMDKCICTAGTVLLEFIPPQRIWNFFKSAARAFKLSCSETIPLNEGINQWIDQLRSDCLHGTIPDEYDYCNNLCRLLRKYPDIVLGSLVVPLHGCTIMSHYCKQCKERSEPRC